MVVGSGLACEMQYHALLILAEEARILYGFSVYDPRPEAERQVKEDMAILEEYTRRNQLADVERRAKFDDLGRPS